MHYEIFYLSVDHYLIIKVSYDSARLDLAHLVVT